MCWKLISTTTFQVKLEEGKYEDKNAGIILIVTSFNENYTWGIKVIFCVCFGVCLQFCVQLWFLGMCFVVVLKELASQKYV